MQARKKKHLPIKLEKDADQKSNEKKSSKLNKVKDKSMKIKKRKRLIIRNLSFQVTPDELKDTFSKFGEVKNVNIPLKEDGRKRGFAFVEFEDFKPLIVAMKALNNKEIHGRRVAIDYAVNKTDYQLKLQNIKKEKEDSPQKQIDTDLNTLSDEDSEDEKPNLIEDEEEDIDEDEKRVNEFLKDFDSGIEAVQHDDEDSSDESAKDSEEDEKSDDDDEDSVDENESSLKGSSNKQSFKDKFSTNRKISHDVSEGKTVFLRNVSFATSKESLKEVMEKYGECEYCLICIDPVTEHSKGTAFVKFKTKECADKLIEDSMNEPGILVDGRKLTCSLAVSKETIFQHKDQLKKPQDRRNLRLLKVGLILPNSEESEGVSPPDMAKRSQLERLKNQKLKNVNFFVSDKRLMIHNLPKTITDAKLRQLFKDAAGKGAVVTEARVMRDFKKTSSEGIPLSRGFGFVSFSKHEDALKAIEKLNNNPKIFTPQKRPIVEFSVENKVALLTKERRKEKLKQRNKKRSEEKEERKSNEKIRSSSNVKVPVKKTKKRKKESKISDEKGNPVNNAISSVSPSKKQKKRQKSLETAQADCSTNILEDSQISKKQKKKTKRKSKKNKSPVKSKNVNQETFNSMVNKFKEKLLNKI